MCLRDQVIDDGAWIASFAAQNAHIRRLLEGLIQNFDDVSESDQRWNYLTNERIEHWLVGVLLVAGCWKWGRTFYFGVFWCQFYDNKKIVKKN
jgi:hypothetical protein